VTDEVREDLADALSRLAISDLGIAEFQLTVGNDFGARLHASRALEEAGGAGDEVRARRAQAILDSLPAPVEAP
jgi:hypothetical protein